MDKEIEIYKNIGLKLRFLRKSRNLTILDVSTKLQINKGSLTKYELGIDKIPIHNLYKLAEFFNVDITSFFKEDTNNHLDIKIARKKLIGTTGKNNFFYYPENNYSFLSLPRDLFCSFIIQISDDSMFPIIKNGAYVGISPLFLNKKTAEELTFFQFKKNFNQTINELFEGQLILINFANIGIFIRRIVEIDGKNDKIKLGSENSKLPLKTFSLSDLININNLKRLNQEPFFSIKNIAIDTVIGEVSFVAQSLS